jgi:hypothetical protein
MFWKSCVKNVGGRIVIKEDCQKALKHMVTVYVNNRIVSTVDLDDFNKDVVTFGRARENDIVITSSLVSKRHGAFVINDGILLVKNLNSTNGIIVNGAVSEEKELNNGDSISIDDNEITNLKKICDEVFGETNFRNFIAVRRYGKNINRQFLDSGLPSLNVGLEFILVYAKNEITKLSPVFREASSNVLLLAIGRDSGIMLIDPL